MTFSYRYSQWDGSQDIPPLDPDDILAGLTDDLMNFGDLQHALRNLLQRGMRNPLGQRMQGLREILGMETETLDRRLDEANRQIEGGERPLQAFEEAVKPSSQETTAEEEKSLAH